MIIPKGAVQSVQLVSPLSVSPTGQFKIKFWQFLCHLSGNY